MTNLHEMQLTPQGADMHTDALLSSMLHVRQFYSVV